MSTLSKHYFHSIDGLRAIAVLLVLLFHVDPHWIPGGFIGVDIFFVISGFLITRNIIQEHEQNRFSFLDFYARRVARLLPAMLAVVIVTLVSAWAILTPEDLANAGKAGVFSSLSASNFLFWYESGYFERASEAKPFLHTWSLAVEEQFYFVWPALLTFFFIKRNRVVVAAALFAASIISLISAVIYAGIDSSAVFFLMPFRIYQFGLGGLLALLVNNYSQGLRGDIIAIAAVSGLILISFFVDSNTPLWVAAVLPAVCSMLFIYASDSETVKQVFASSPMQWIGKRSYSIYLTHWPIIVLYRLAGNYKPALTEKCVLVALSIASGVLLHNLVERRFRFTRTTTTSEKRIIITGTVATLALAVLLGAQYWHKEGFPQRALLRIEWSPPMTPLEPVAEAPIPQADNDAIKEQAQPPQSNEQQSASISIAKSSEEETAATAGQVKTQSSFPKKSPDSNLEPKLTEKISSAEPSKTAPSSNQQTPASNSTETSEAQSQQIQAILNKIPSMWAEKVRQLRIGICEVQKGKYVAADFNKTACLEPHPNKPTWLVLGDSFAGDSYIMLKETYPEYNFNQMSLPGCRLSLDHPGMCNELYTFIFDYLSKPNHIKGVIIASDWWNTNQAKWAVDKLLSLTPNVVLINQRQQFLELVPTVLQSSKSLPQATAKLQQMLDEKKVVVADEIAAKLGKRLPIVDFVKLQCPADCDIFDEKNELIYLDKAHMSLPGLKLMGRRLKATYPGLLIVDEGASQPGTTPAAKIASAGPSQAQPLQNKPSPSSNSKTEPPPPEKAVPTNTAKTQPSPNEQPSSSKVISQEPSQEIQAILNKIPSMWNEKTPQMRLGKCALQVDKFAATDFDQTACLAPHPSKPTWLVLGDSYATDVYIMFKETYPEYNFNQLNVPGCSARVGGTGMCKELYSFVFDYLSKPSHIKGVIITSNWWNADQAVGVVDKLLSLNVKVVLINQRWQFLESVPVVIRSSKNLPQAASKLQQMIDEKRVVVAKEIASQVGKRLPVVDFAKLQCPAECDIVDDQKNELIYLDHGHMSVSGLALMGRRMKAAYPGLLTN